MCVHVYERIRIMKVGCMFPDKRNRPYVLSNFRHVCRPMYGFKSLYSVQLSFKKLDA